MNTHAKTVAELAAGLKKKEFSSVELTKLYLDRAAASQAELNSFVSVTRDEALAQAAAADRALAAGRAGPITGVPIAHKDIFCTQGVRTTCGSRMLDNFVAPYDATVVTKLKAAGAVMVGKTNMDEFAMGSSNETSYFGAVRNPWDPAMVPGGSSGGSAAAVGARLVPAATATDTGGSIRQPAALCGVTGIKPTYGRVSRYGMIAFASSLDQGGVIAGERRRCGAGAGGHVRFRPERLHERRPSGTGLCGRARQAAEGQADGGRAHRPAQGVLREGSRRGSRSSASATRWPRTRSSAPS